MSLLTNNNNKSHVTWSEKSAKNLLQFFFQSSWQPHAVPIYYSASKGLPHMRVFYVHVALPPLPAVSRFIEINQFSEASWMYGFGEASTKKEAEKMAADDACRKLLFMGLLNVPPVFRNDSDLTQDKSVAHCHTCRCNV
jgi:dsRNA-specific ribonuclease